MIVDKTLIFVDGENLIRRYEEMVKGGRIPRPDNVYIKGSFVWNQRVLDDQLWDVKRLSYYTHAVGDDNTVQSVRQKISATVFRCTTDPKNQLSFSGQIIPFVRKKLSKAKKESICDISIAVDVMRACYRDHAEAIWLFSGDGDFVQLVEEAVHAGKRVYQSAFSSGLNDELRYVVDEFILLDNFFFLTEDELAAAAELENDASKTFDLESLKPSGDKNT